MTYGILPNGKQQFIDSNGNPLASGKVYYYIPSTTTFKNTYQNSAGTVLNTNPVVLDANGQCIAYGTGSYRQQVYDVYGNLIWDVQVDSPLTSGNQTYDIEEQTFTATSGQTVFTLTTMSYVPGTHNLSVFVDGLKQIVGVNYTETSSTVVTFTTGLHVGAVVDFTTAVLQTNANIVPATDVTYNEGGTGAVTTTVAAKLQQTVSVLDFGADPTGTTDSTTAFQNALNAAHSLGKPVYVPAGSYTISTTLTSVYPVKIYGDTGMHTYGYSIINYMGTGNCFTFGNTSSQSFSNHYMTFEVKNLVINGQTGTGNGITAYNISFVFEKLWIKNFGQYGVYAPQSYASVVRDCQFQSNFYGMLLTDVGGAVKLDSCAFLSNTFGLVFTGHLTGSAFSGGIYSIEVSQCDFEGNTYGVYFGQTASSSAYDIVSSIQFNTTHFESNANNFYSGSGVTLEGISCINSNFADGTSTFSKEINCSFINPVFFGTSVLTVQNGYNAATMMINPTFDSGWSGSVSGVGCIGMGSYVSGKAPIGTLVVASNQTANSANAYILRGAGNNLYAPLVQAFGGDVSTSGGAVSILSTDPAECTIFVNEAVSSVTATITNTASQYGAKQTYILSTNNSSSLNKTVTFTGVGATYKYNAITTPNATTAVTIINFVYTSLGWLETGRVTNLAV